MKIRDKIITAVCRSVEGMEWTSWKITAEGTELLQQAALPLSMDGETTEKIIASIELPEQIKELLLGDITVALRTSELLLRVMELPTSDAAEIHDMVVFQLDKISPLPADQLAISHEILHQTEGKSLVLMAAAKRQRVDAIGDLFKKSEVLIHSIDARVLGWTKLLQEGGHLTNTGCEIILIDDGIDLSLVILDKGIPVAFRMLDAQTDDMNVVDELAYEIGYTLTTLNTERDLPAPTAIQFWSHEPLCERLCAKLSKKGGLPVQPQQLATLPPLSEGILRRAQAPDHRIEFIPREWVEHETRKQLRRKFTWIASSIAAVWIAVLLIFFTVYAVRDAQLTRVQDRLATLEPVARQALQNRQKLKTLQLYTDRSDSALECLREVTRTLPIGDIEFVSYNYKKGKGVTLRGSSPSDDTVYDYFEALTASDLFEQIKDQSVNNKTSKGVRRAVFSVNLVLPSEEASP